MIDLNRQELRNAAQSCIHERKVNRGDIPESAGFQFGNKRHRRCFEGLATPVAILSLLDENEELRSLLADRVIDSTALVNFAANRGGLSIELDGGGCALLAETLGQQLYESQAVNYIEATFESRLHPELGKIVVTVKRETGKTPHKLRLAAEAERDQLRAEVEALRKDADRWRHARTILPVDAIADAQAEFENYGLPCDEVENLRADAAIDSAMAKEVDANV